MEQTDQNSVLSLANLEELWKDFDRRMNALCTTYGAPYFQAVEEGDSIMTLVLRLHKTPTQHLQTNFIPPKPIKPQSILQRNFPAFPFILRLASTTQHQAST